jgi:hypothetical protein
VSSSTADFDPFAPAGGDASSLAPSAATAERPRAAEAPAAPQSGSSAAGTLSGSDVVRHSVSESTNGPAAKPQRGASGHGLGAPRAPDPARKGGTGANRRRRSAASGASAGLDAARGLFASAPGVKAGGGIGLGFGAGATSSASSVRAQRMAERRRSMGGSTAGAAPGRLGRPKGRISLPTVAEAPAQPTGSDVAAATEDDLLDLFG